MVVRIGGWSFCDAAALSRRSSTLHDITRVNATERFREMKRRGQRITALTAYDYPTARLLDESGLDIILVGDSLGMVVLGHEDTTQVTLDEMLHHTRAVARGVKRALIVADMPIHSYEDRKSVV